jgi:hypothetical protein
MYWSASTEAENHRICYLHKNIHLYQCLVQILLMPWSHQDQCFRLVRGFGSLPAGSDRPRASVSYEFAGDTGPADRMFNFVDLRLLFSSSVLCQHPNNHPGRSATSQGRWGSSMAQRRPLEARYCICEVRSGKNLQARSAVVYSGPVLPSRES